MEETKGISFTSIVAHKNHRSTNNDVKPKSSSPKQRHRRGIKHIDYSKFTCIRKIDVGGGVTMIVANIENPPIFNSVQDIIDFDKENPDSIVAFEPPLSPFFLDESNSIIQFAKIGDLVVRTFKFKNRDTEVPTRLESLRFKSLGNMSVIIANLHGGDSNLFYYLEVYKYNG